MPITVLPDGAAALAGPGQWIAFSSTTVTTPSPGWSWHVDFFAPGTEQGAAIVSIPATSLNQRATYGTPQNPITYSQFVQLAEGATTTANVFLVDDQGAFRDSGTATMTWSNSFLGNTVQQFASGGGTGGFTDTDRQQLQAVAGSTVLEQLVNTFILTPLTAGPEQGPVNAVLTNPVFAIIVRIANVPPDLVVGTPDGNYWFHDLAVVRIFRGSDLWLRVPIHTSSKIITLPWQEAILPAIADVIARNWLTDMTLQVNFAPGVTGEVFLQHVP